MSTEIDEWRLSKLDRAKCLRMGWNPDALERAARELGRALSDIAATEAFLALIAAEPVKPTVGRGHVPRTWNHKVKRT